MALGRPVDIAINHDPDAILMHKTNHPDTLGLYHRPGLQLEAVSDCKAGGANREQRGSNYGTETGRSELSVSEGW